MRYSLYSRFRGTLIGAMVGEMLGKSRGITQHLTYPNAWRTCSQVQLPPRNFQTEGQLATLLAQSLLQLGRFDLNDWRNILDNNPSSRWLPDARETLITNSHVSMSIIMPMLPIMLFYHDNEIKLRQNLQLALSELGYSESVNRDGALAVGYAIAQALKEKLKPTNLIAKTIAFLGEPQSQLTQQLTQVQTLLEQGTSLNRAVTELSADAQASSPIALAFYCCLSTLEDFRLCVIRSVQQSEQPEIIGMITGALSGAYNSLSGIPVPLRLALSRHPHRPLTAWGVTTEAEMLQLADSLVAVWSGIYNQIGHQTDLVSVAAIAAPTIIRSR